MYTVAETMPLYIRDLSICKLQCPEGSWKQSVMDTRGPLKTKQNVIHQIEARPSGKQLKSHSPESKLNRDIVGGFSL